MKLSEAIRKGAKLHPQANGEYLIFEGDEPHTCAIGAAFEAITGLLPYDYPPSVYEEGDPRIVKAMELAEQGSDGDFIADVVMAACGIDVSDRIETPVTQYPKLVTHAAIDLNDVKHMTREEIADYIAQFGF